MSGRMLRTIGVLGALPAAVRACTTIVVSAGASADGSTMTTHTDDSAVADSRMAYVPARRWPAGSRRPVYFAKASVFRFVGDRSETYAPLPGQALSQPIGDIPQVPETYAYWEARYAYTNEHGLTIGESTCTGKFVSTNATAMLGATELARLAQERCRTARCGVRTMGSLAEEHGFLGEDPGHTGSGEALSIGDGKEVWVFHVTATPSGKGAFWVAQRVPDGHVSLVANNFVIRKVDCAAADFMCSRDLLEGARAAGVWDGKGKLDFTAAFAEDAMTYSYFQGFVPIPEYTSGRVWRIFSRVAPSMGLRMERNPLVFPFSVPADRKLTARDVMDLQRDHYEGTELDLTQGAFAGPFGNPNRFEGGVGQKVIKGLFARAISIPRTAFAVVGQSYGSSDAGLSKLWFSSDSPASSVFVPFYAKTSRFAEPYRIGHMSEYDERSAWWTFDFVANWMNMCFRLMKVDVDAKLNELQDEIDGERAVVERHAASELKAGRSESACDHLEEFQVSTQQRVVDSWRSFGRFLIMKYNDGFLNYPAIGTQIGLPTWYLEMNGFDRDPTPKWVQPSSEEPDLLRILGPGPQESLPPALEKVALSTSASYVPTSLVASPAVSQSVATSLLLVFSVSVAFAAGRASKRGHEATDYVRA